MKRVFDIVVSSAGLTVLWPVMLVIAIQVRRKLGAPVLFRQARPGLHGEPFEIVKFRTMRALLEDEAKAMSDSQRLTDFGRFLRRASLDELPELWNVLKGDMSIIGPRPLLMSYLDKYTPGQMRRHEARPGITGWAQVSGRNAISWEQKFACDVWYVDNASFWLDMRILCKTVSMVARRSGINQPGHATMPEFGREAIQGNRVQHSLHERGTQGVADTVVSDRAR